MDFDEFRVKLGQRVKYLREKRGLNQEDLDEGEFPVSVTGLQQIEYGKVDPRLYTLWRIAWHLKVDIRELLRF